MTSEEILTYFYETFNFKKNKGGWIVNLDLNKFKYKIYQINNNKEKISKTNTGLNMAIKNLPLQH